jgi:hypothetical protein
MLSLDETCVLIAQWDELQGFATHGDFVALLAEPEEKTEVPIYSWVSRTIPLKPK